MPLTKIIQEKKDDSLSLTFDEIEGNHLIKKDENFDK